MKIIEIKKDKGMFLVPGDMVKYVSGRHGDTLSNPQWCGEWGKVKGKIMEIDEFETDCPIRVDWDNGHSNVYDNTDLRLI